MWSMTIPDPSQFSIVAASIKAVVRFGKKCRVDVEFFDSLGIRIEGGSFEVSDGDAHCYLKANAQNLLHGLVNALHDEKGDEAKDRIAALMDMHVWEAVVNVRAQEV